MGTPLCRQFDCVFSFVVGLRFFSCQKVCFFIGLPYLFVFRTSFFLRSTSQLKLKVHNQIVIDRVPSLILDLRDHFECLQIYMGHSFCYTGI